MASRLWHIPSAVGLVVVALLFVNPELYYNEPFMGLSFLVMNILIALAPWRGER